jgi:hypothetical protein
VNDNKILRYWVEIRSLSSGEVRTPPLCGIRLVHIPRRKTDPRRPDEELLQLTDGNDKMRAKNLDDLAAQLRERYPDEGYERSLHSERDREAERRHKEALNGLIELVAQSMVKDTIKRGEP